MEYNKWTTLTEPALDINKQEIKVIKYGQTTSFTYGTLNETVEINPELLDWEHFGSYDLTSFRTILAYQIWMEAGPKVSSTFANGDAFLAPGDAGCVIQHEKTGRWLGLGIGCTVEGQGLMTPIDLVLKDIQKVTGQEVVEPIYEPVPEPGGT